MKEKVLIPTRGIIALDIINSLNSMGMETLLMHSPEDALSLPVKLADRSFKFYSSRLEDSYLDGEAIVEKARAVKAGYIQQNISAYGSNVGYSMGVDWQGLNKNHGGDQWVQNLRGATGNFLGNSILAGPMLGSTDSKTGEWSGAFPNWLRGLGSTAYYPADNAKQSASNKAISQGKQRQAEQYDENMVYDVRTGKMRALTPEEAADQEVRLRQSGGELNRLMGQASKIGDIASTPLADMVMRMLEIPDPKALERERAVEGAIQREKEERRAIEKRRELIIEEQIRRENEFWKQQPIRTSSDPMIKIGKKAFQNINDIRQAVGDWVEVEYLVNTHNMMPEQQPMNFVHSTLWMGSLFPGIGAVSAGFDSLIYNYERSSAISYAKDAELQGDSVNARVQYTLAEGYRSATIERAQWAGFQAIGGAFIKSLTPKAQAPSKPTWNLGGPKSATKWQNQMVKRGWTPQQIDEAMAGGQKFSAVNNINKGNAATRYVHPQTGRSVVVDNVTNEVLHVGGDGFKY